MTTLSEADPGLRAPATPSHDVATRAIVNKLRRLATERLAEMYRPDLGLFVFRLRLSNGRLLSEGTSARYTAITLLGLAAEEPATVSAVLSGQTAQAVCDRLIDSLGHDAHVGDVALLCWAARAVSCRGHRVALDRLLSLDPATRECPTVELAWTLSALCGEPSDRARAACHQVAARLAGLHNEAATFPHHTGGARGLRTHVSCFADQVYPILALSQYASVTGDKRALATARATADHICRAQGDAGQWWWHYHAQAGTVVERYPVYSVHQHAMAPMALTALQRVSGADYRRPIARGLEWLGASPEIGGTSLIDPVHRVIWRKVGRREPAKTARYLQAAITRVHPSARWPWLDQCFPPGAIDRECRPYELGWLLYAWPFVAESATL